MKRAALDAALLFCVGEVLRSITSSHSADAPIVALDCDGATPTEPSSLVSVIVISVVPLAPSRPPSINTNAARSNVHALSQRNRLRGVSAEKCEKNAGVVYATAPLAGNLAPERRGRFIPSGQLTAFGPRLLRCRP